MNFRIIATLAAGWIWINFSHAQISITQSAMPSAGDTIRYSTATISGQNLNISQNGPSQSWDYSALVSNGQDLYQYVSANKTPYFFYFFNQLGLKTADSIGVSQFSFKNIYSFYSRNSTVFRAEGLGFSFQGIPLAANYTNEDEIYQFPLEYHDSDVSTFRFVFEVPGQNLFKFVQAGTRVNYVDGWGSIKTPYKTYNSVLRVKTIIDETDTLVTQFTSLPFPRKQVIYKWLSADEKIPVLEITGTEVGGNFTPSRITFRDAYNGKANPLAPQAGFVVNRTTGYANADTFQFADQSRPFATGFQWQITPSAGVRYVKGTSSNSRNPSVVFSIKGMYSVTLIATNQAGTDDTTATDLISIEYGAGISHQDRNFGNLFPNPCDDRVQIAGHKEGLSYRIVDFTGKLIAQGKTGSGGMVGTAMLPAGIYLLVTEHGRDMMLVQHK